MMTIEQKTRLMSMLREPDNADLLEVVMGLDTLRPEQVKTPRQQINELQGTRNMRNVDWVDERINRIIASAKEPQHQPQTVFDVVYKVTGINREAITTHNRKRETADIRHLSIGLMCSHCLRYSLISFARMIDRNHATVLHSCRMFETLTDTDPAFRAKREKCEAMLRERN